MVFRQQESQSLGLQTHTQQQMGLVQRLMMSSQMQQALHLLQLPTLEVIPYVEEQIVENPILEICDNQATFEEKYSDEESGREEIEKDCVIDENDLSILSRLEEDWREHFSSDVVPIKKSADEEKLKVFQEQSVCALPTLGVILNQQARDTFEFPQDLEIAQLLIGYIDALGFLTTPLEEIAELHGFKEDNLHRILRDIQTFEPYGIGASTIRESLLIQLKCLGKQNTLAYQLIEDHYPELLKNALPLIQKRLKCTHEELRQAIEKDISKLDLHPGTHFNTTVTQPIIPDVTLYNDNGELRVEVERDLIPSLRLNSRYLKWMRHPDTPPETLQFLKRHLLSAKWLMRNLNQRYSTIERIATFLMRYQRSFFLNPQGQLIPLTMKTVADALDLHESTIARTVSNKYLNCPRGIFPLRSFFTSKFVAEDGQTLSSQTVKEAMCKLLETEDPLHPYSDEKISILLKSQGIACARRTVAKYRMQFKIGNTQQRKKFE